MDDEARLSVGPSTVLGMTRFAVDPAALSGIAASVRAAADEAESACAEHNGIATTSLGDAELESALRHFTDRWRYGLDTLVDDARRLADGLDLAAGLYADADRAAATLVSGAGP